MAKMSTWPTYTLLAIFILPVIVFSVFEYFQPDKTNKTAVITASSTQIENTNKVVNKKVVFTKDDKWQDIYQNTKLMTIGDVEVNASIAKTWPERITGLSGTPYLPDEVVKLFVFDSPGLHSIWMKDMKYAIDIIWLSEEGDIVYITKNATPESYPENFIPDQVAYFVIETNEGFVDRHNIKKGEKVSLPNFD